MNLNTETATTTIRTLARIAGAANADGITVRSEGLQRVPIATANGWASAVVAPLDPSVTGTTELDALALLLDECKRCATVCLDDAERRAHVARIAAENAERARDEAVAYFTTRRAMMQALKGDR